MSRSGQRPAAESPARASSIGRLLEKFCRSSCARSAVLVDEQGEAVDFHGQRSAFDLRLAAAEGRILLGRLESARGPLGGTWEVRLRAARRSFLVLSLSEGYAVVAELPRYAFGVSPRALGALARDLRTDSGLRFRAAVPLGWAAVRVRTAPAPSRRPLQVCLAGRWLPADVLGTVAGAALVAGEVGYRVRASDGAELTLVREPGGYWFAEPHTLLGDALAAELP